MIVGKGVATAPALLLVGAMSLYGIGTLSASVPRWLVIYAGAALCAGWLASRRIAWDRVDAAALALFGYMAASLLWSGDWRQGLYGLVNAGALLSLFVAIRRLPRPTLACLPVAALAGTAAALILQFLYPHDYGGHGNHGFQTELILAGLALGWGSPWWLWWPVCAASAVYLVGFNDSRIEYVVMTCLAVCALASKAPFFWRAICRANLLASRSE